MTITVNGQPTECPEGTTVTTLLEQLGTPTAGIAVARNEAVVPRPAHGSTVLQAGDRIEIIHAVAGG